MYKLLRNYIMSRGGLQPRGVYIMSKSGILSGTPAKDRLSMPNLVGSFHAVLRVCWEHYGLGQNCLLVSESRKVSRQMAKHYAGTTFTSCDLFPELMRNSAEDGPDVIWDVCAPPPNSLRDRPFNSVICHALLEHVIAPTSAIQHMLTLLCPSGRLYFMTHTPSYHKHQYPRDYVRFHHDYFEDLPDFYAKSAGLKSELSELHSTEGVVCGVYTRLG